MENDIRRKTEIVLRDELATRLGVGWKVLVARGGTDNPDEEAAVQTPPFVVVQARAAEKTMAQENTWLVNVAVGYVTELTDTLPKDHSANLRTVLVALEGILPGYDPDQKFRLHGIDVMDTNAFSDQPKRARGDIITCVVGCSG